MENGNNRAAKAEHPVREEQKEIMDIKTLAKYLGIGKSKIYNLIRQKKIPASRIGRQYRFSKEVVDGWLKERIITRGEEPQISLFKKEEVKPEKKVQRKVMDNSKDDRKQQ